jgi:hypothetical protein
MADIAPIIETLENRWMRAWAGGDVRTLKALTSRKFRLVVGTKPSVLLDTKSWLEAANSSFLCHSFRFGDIYARDLGRVAIFATQLELHASIEGQDWSGRMWVTAIWRKSRLRRGWQMVERVISRTEDDKKVAAAIKALQLWQRPGKLQALASSTSTHHSPSLRSTTETPSA